jgi:hypothetical protein
MKLKMELREKLKVKNLNGIHSNTISNYQYQTYPMFGDLKIDELDLFIHFTVIKLWSKAHSILTIVYLNNS